MAIVKNNQTFSGDIDFNGVNQTVTLVGGATLSLSSSATFEAATGATFDMGANLVSAVLDPVGAQDAATKAYVDANAGDPATWSTFPATQNVNMDSHKLTSVTDPTSAQDAATKNYVDTNFVALTGAQTIAGVKTFSSAPVMSGASITSGTIPIASVVGTAMDLTTSQTAAGVKTFSSAPVMSGASITSGTIPIASVVGTAVALSGSQTISGAKTFSGGLITNAFQLTASPTSGYVLTSDGSGNGTWGAPGTEFTTATVGTSSTSATTIATIAVGSASVSTIKAYITGKNTATNDNWTGGEIVATVSNASGTAALVNTTYPVVMPTSTGSFDVVVSSGNALIQVTAPSAAAYSWKVLYVAVNV